MYLRAFKPTFLYIKQHSKTGMLYFGKTVKNPNTYHGSGKYWQRHIKKHGKKLVITLWFCLFYSKDECTQFATMFSKQENIAKSSKWANLISENGLDGGIIGPKSDQHKASMRASMAARKKKGIKLGGLHSEDHKNAFLEGSKKYWTGKTFTEERKQQISKQTTGKNNPNAKIWKIEDTDGTIFTLHSCKQWCKDNGMLQRTLINRSNSGKYTNGFRIVS
jgi:hypothetical protein